MCFIFVLRFVVVVVVVVVVVLWSEKPRHKGKKSIPKNSTVKVREIH